LVLACPLRVCPGNFLFPARFPGSAGHRSSNAFCGCPDSAFPRSLFLPTLRSLFVFALGGTGISLSDISAGAGSFLSISPVIIAGILLGRYVYLPQENRSLVKNSPNLPTPHLCRCSLPDSCGILLIQVPGTLGQCPYPAPDNGSRCRPHLFTPEQKKPDPLINPSLLKKPEFYFWYIACFIVTALFSELPISCPCTWSIPVTSPRFLPA